MNDHFQKEKDLEAISDINVVPLADVSLVLLIILLLLSPMMTQSMLHVKTAGQAAPSTLPDQPDPLPPPKPPEMVLMVDIGPRGIAIGQQLFGSEADFITYLTDELPRRADRKVFLAPHPDVIHGEVVRMLETIKSCGAESVALVQMAETP